MWLALRWLYTLFVEHCGVEPVVPSDLLPAAAGDVDMEEKVDDKEDKEDKKVGGCTWWGVRVLGG